MSSGKKRWGDLWGDVQSHATLTKLSAQRGIGHTQPKELYQAEENIIQQIKEYCFEVLKF